MGTNSPVPYFPTPPSAYSQDYLNQLVRAFSTFIQQTNNPGETVFATLRLIRLKTYANNAAAVAGGLAVDDIYKTSTGEIRIVV
ncbi:hypothetical protein UFOVP1202_16 [uncultured Caudovirales phage]|uniref:Uncharacterized protein n=1 Tax=uncultured Caudovirales phage TaxID=2100421 RepID=A0A6J5QZT2_9CAUD|nr:hypothetical protein UFOVP1202_16 [uncultured Caudovirales phage]